MEDIAIKYNNKHLCTPIKSELEMFKAHNSVNWNAGNCTYNGDDDDDINNSCRRSKRTRIKNLRYRSDEENNVGFVDDRLKQILIEFGLCDELYTFLKSKGITAQALQHMQIRHIDELFKGTRLNTKIIFEHRLKEWQDKNHMETNCYNINNQNKQNLSEANSTTQQFLRDTDITNLENLLTNAVQQTINSVLQEFKQTWRNQPSEKKCNYSLRSNKEEVPTETISLKNIKTEPNPCFDENVVTDENSEKIVNNSQKIFKVSDEILLSNRSVEINLSPLPKKRKLDVNMSVQEILAQSTTCHHLFDEYETSGLLTPNQQTQIVRCIVDFYIRNNLSMSIGNCKAIAKEIVELFPSESRETYFIKDNKSRFPKGKIWERYQGHKRSIRKLLALNTCQETLKNDSSMSDKEDTLNNINDWSEMQAICSEMKHIHDEKELFEKWKESFAFRRHQLQTGWFSTWKFYFDEYPFCKQQNYAQYIESDLETLYPDLKFDDFLWDEFLKMFPNFLNHITHPKSKHLYDQLISIENLNICTDYVAIKVFELLHAALKTNTNKLQNIEDTQRKFTIEVNDLSDLKKVVIDRKKFCADYNVQAKPYVAVVGQNKMYSNFSVILDSTGFSCDNYKDSLILCFNLYLFFDISFPRESLNVWTFIQKYFFNKPPLVKNPRIDTFINEIKSHKTVSLGVK